jgi:hypothetical protein
MIRRMIQSALCIFFPPLLVAQQATQQLPNPPAAQPAPAHLRLSLPKNAIVRWIIPDPASLSEVATGEMVQFVIDTDIMAGNAKVIHANVPVTGVVDHVKHSSRFRHSDGQIFVRITEIVSGRTTEAVVGCPNPADVYVAASSGSRSGGVSRAISNGINIGLAIFFVLIIMAGTGGMD